MHGAGPRWVRMSNDRFTTVVCVWTRSSGRLVVRCLRVWRSPRVQPKDVTTGERENNGMLVETRMYDSIITAARQPHGSENETLHILRVPQFYESRTQYGVSSPSPLPSTW